MTGRENRGERLQVMLSEAELTALDDFRFKKRMPSRAEQYAERKARGERTKGRSRIAAARVPPTMVASTTDQPGNPCAASTMAGNVVTSSSSMIRGLVSATLARTGPETASPHLRHGGRSTGATGVCVTRPA